MSDTAQVRLMASETRTVCFVSFLTFWRLSIIPPPIVEEQRTVTQTISMQLRVAHSAFFDLSRNADYLPGLLVCAIPVLRLINYFSKQFILISFETYFPHFPKAKKQTNLEISLPNCCLEFSVLVKVSPISLLLAFRNQTCMYSLGNCRRNAGFNL